MSEERITIARNQAQAPFFIGLDLGGTNIKVGVLDDLGRTLHYLTTPTDVPKGPEDSCKRMSDAIRRAIGDAGLKASDVAAVGLGSPGTLDVPGRKLMEPANLPGWEYFPVPDRVQEHCGLPVVFSHDGNAAACGESWVGSGRGLKSLILLTLGTGVGCGIMLGDLMLDGEHSHAGEFAHSIFDISENARLCGCGRRGCFEAYTSATAVIKRTQEAIQAGAQSSVSDRLAAGAAMNAKLVAEEAEKGDALCCEIIGQTAEFLGIGIVNLMHTIDPHGILIGGAMTFGGKATSLGRRFLGLVNAVIQRRAYAHLAKNTVIDFASLGGDAGYIGAAGIARIEYHKRNGR
jgi:glucokinase